MKYIRITALMLVFCFAFSAFAIDALALSWDGSSEGGNGFGRDGGTTGYAVRATDINANLLGYRFSLVDKNGNSKVSTPIDVFLNASNGSNHNKFTSKLNKKQLIDGQNRGYSTSKSTSYCYSEADMRFTTSLPAPGGLEVWQNNAANINAVLSALGAGSVNNLTFGDKVIVEPLWDIRLQSVYHALTTTEIAIYGKAILGANSDGGSSGTPESWGFISAYTNRNFPNALFTPDGQGLWSGINAIGSSSRETFYNIINKGYGAGIAYNENKPDFTPNLGVNVCEAWRGSRSARTYHYGTSNGSSFWNYTPNGGYPIMGETVWFSVYFPQESNNVTVRQYVRLQGGSWTTRDVSSSSTWFDVALSPTTVDAGRSCYIVEAKVDYLRNGIVRRSGAVKTFYIPVRPKINRTQVTMFDIQNTQVARNGSSGGSGSLYVGQKVYPRYTYTSSNTWTSSNNFSAAINGGADVSFVSNINNSAAVERNSTKNPFVVPNVTSLPHVLTTSWSSDSSRTMENTAINIPVIKADVELKEIRLIDGTNNTYVSGSRLWVHQKVTPQYVYKNNTNMRVFVEGYDNDQTRIGGSTAVYSIPANGEIAVNGKQITVGHVTTQSIWGGVYLDDAGRGNTAWESNDSNNTKTVSFSVQHPLTIQTVTPNSNYRENTEVITGFRVYNAAHFHFTPGYNITVRFTALNGGATLHTASKTVVIPANGDNLVYFKWTVPSNLNGASITLKGEVIDGGRIIDTKTMTNGSEKKPASQTPDTVFEKKAPSGFTVISPPTRTNALSAQWSEWFYENNAFVRRTYGLNLNTASLPATVPDVNSPSREQKNGVWHMASGYGFTTDWSVGIQTMSGTTAPTAAMYTNSQLAMLYFPEFKYANTINSFRVLDRTAVNRFQLPINFDAKNSARLHFVPLWFPNGNYRVQGYVGDIWTPAGMISGYMNSAPMVISQSAYDDWYIGR